MMEQRTKFSAMGLRCEFMGELQQDVQSISDVRNAGADPGYIKGGVLEMVAVGVSRCTIARKARC